MLLRQFNLIFTLSVILLFVLACNFKFSSGDDSSNKEFVSRKKSSENTNIPKKKSSQKDKEDTSGEKETSSESETEIPQKLGSYTYQRFDYSVYLVPKNTDENELIKIAQQLHDQEPKSFLVLVDDDAQAAEFITHHEELDKGTPQGEYPHDWATKHVVGQVQLWVEDERRWYLMKGNGYEKITELE